MMRHRSWLAGLASKIFPRRFAAARRASRRRPTHSLRSFSDAPLAAESLEPRHLLSATPFEPMDANSGTITGWVWNDTNANSGADQDELGAAGVTVYLDANNDAALNNSEITTTTNADGSYEFIGNGADVSHALHGVTSDGANFYAFLGTNHPFNTTIPQARLESLAIDVLAFDGALSDSATVTITLTGNSPPLFQDQTLSIAENSAAGSLVGAISASDPEGDAVTYAITGNVDPDGDGNAAFMLVGDLLYTMDVDDLDYEANPQLVITAEASDGSLTDTAQITVNVTDVNENPVAMDDAHQVLANAELTVGAAGVLGNDTDADGDALTAVLVSSTSNGILSFNADGSFTYTSDANFAGDDTFTYQVSDGTNLSNVATVTISVIPYVTFGNPTNSDYADFGWSTAIDGDRVLIGTPRGVAFGTEIGKAHLFDLQGNLLQTFDDPVLTAEDWFGASVAISGDYVLISDSGDDTAGTNIGQAHLFDAATGNLLHTFSDPTPTTEDHFGAFVAIEGGQILIGDYRDDTAAENSGQVHLFDAASRSLLRTIQNPNTTTPSNNRFGSAGDISDGRILVGATNDGIGRAHLFDASDGSLLHSFDDPTADNKDYFASSVALDGNYIVIGAFEDDSLLPSAGQAYVFDATTGLLLHTLDNPEPNNMEWFGEAVAIDGSRIVVGAMLNRVDGYQIGEAYLFDAVSGDLVRTFEEPTPTEFDLFGHGVAIDGDHVLIGAYHHRNTELDIATGEAYLYHLAAGTPPVFDDQSFSVAENSADGTVVGTLAATDADGDALTYSIASNIDPDGDGNDTFRIEGDQLLVNDADDLDYEANSQLVIVAEASDGSLSDTAQITINLTDVDEAPTLDPVSDVSIDEDSGELIVSLTGISSGDGTPQLVQITAASNNPNLISDPTISHTPPSETASLSITPEDNKHGAAEITIVVEDAGLDNDLATTADNLTFTQTFTVTVHSVDDTPIFDDQTFTIAENTADGTVIGTLTASDSADQLVYLMDNEDPGFTNMGGTVSTASGYGGSYVWTIPTDFLQTPFGFTFTDLPAADYDIAASWQSGPGEVNGVDRNDSTKFIAVDDVTPTASFTVNQQNWPTPDHVEDSFNFQTIGTGVTVNSGTLAVGVRSGLDGLSNLINADAIRISADNPLTYTITGNYDTDNDGSLAFRVEGNQLLVNDADDLDYEVIDQLTMVVSASDGSLDDDATITVNLTDVADTPATISGTSWNDLNADSVWDEGELGHAGWTIYIDTNINGQLDSGEVTTTTDANGNYSFTGLDPGVYVIAEVPQAGWLQTYPDDNSAGSSSAQGSLQSTGIAGNPPEDLDADGITTESSLETQGVGVPEMVIVADPFFEPLNNAMVLEMGSLQPAGYSLEETFLLHSNPGASKIIYLDFDGHTTSGTPFNYGYGDPIITPAYSFEGDSSHSDAEKQRIQNIWERVSEDFLPFNVDVTTEEPELDALINSGGSDDAWGIRVVIGDDTFHPGDHGGVANMHSFTDDADTPCFVFTDNLSNGNEKYTAECISHEVGHTLGLHHDGNSSDEYYWGHGGGANGWAPIMGASYTRNLTQWSLGEYPDANNAEDDLAIITDANGFDYLADDHEGNTAYASLLGVTAGTTVFDEGIIERNTDLDYFAFTTAPGTISLDIDPFYRGPNLDILATLYDASGVALATSNPTGSLNATFNMSVDGGTYYISVDGTGEGDLISGYSDYGSLGYYSISGTILNGDLPGTHTVAVSYADAITDLNFGNWSNVAPVIADQTFSVAENSTDGTVIGTLAATDANSDSITYSIISNVDPDGDGNDAFRIEGDQLVVHDVGDLDYEANTQLVIMAQASDGGLTDTAEITVNVTNVDEIPVITLLGDSPYVLEASNTASYSDPGATAADPQDGDLTGSVSVSGQVVNLSVPGTYLIEYDVADSAGNDAETVIRTVVVQDTLPPVITLTGDAVVNLPQTIGGTYSDPGATAVDSLDGDLSGSVVVGGDVVDLEQDGAYVITYNVQDNAGNVAEQVTRTVNVIPIVVEDVVILDDGEAGFAQSGFTEQSNAQVAAAYDSDVHHMQGGTGEASWTFTGLPADRYQVAATWAYKYNNNYNATDAPFTLSDGAGGVFSTQIVNQKLTPGEFEDAGVMWDTLDTVEVSGGTLVVTLGAGSAANKYVVADAIRVSVAATLTLSINDASVAESAGAAATTATVTRNGPTDYPVDVDLLVSDATEISVPATVTIPAGQASVAFSIDAVDDVFFDGSQNVNVLATAIGYSDGSDSLEILDDETAHTALIDDGEAGFAQSGFTYQSNAQVAAAYNGDNYNLRNGDDADQASWTFTGLDDGAYHVMATWAHKYNNNYNATDAPFQILDADSNVLSSVAINQKNAPSQHDVGGYFWDTLDTVYVAGGQLTVTVGATTVANKFVVADAVRIEQLVQSSPTLVVQLGEEIVSENAGSVAGIVSRGAETVGDLVVTLSSDDPASGTVPATVTIPDGAGSVAFTLSVVDDAVVDGDQQVAVTATAAGYTGGSDSLLVEDDEFPPVQIMDDGDAGFSTSGGFKDRSWATAYGGDNHNMRGSDGEARWRFTDLIDGEYTVSVTWDHISSNVYNATDAPFTIRNAADEQLLAAAVDQTLSPADFSDGVTDWHTLGTVYVIDGELTVSLTETLVNKYVVADAVRLEIDTNPSPKLLVILDDSSVSEAGTVNGKVIRTGDTAGSLTVNLASDNADAATVPDTITLGEGARYGTFTINPTDDSAPDGIQVTNIGASAEGFAAGTAALDVVDDDATILFVDNGEDGFVADAGFKRRNVPGAYGNNNHYMRGGTGEASWTFTGLEEGQYFVSATWNHVYENRYNTERAPFSIRNGSGNLLSILTVDQTQTPADFTDGGYGWEALAPVYINDGTLIVTLGASSTNHYAVADAIRIELNESLAPSLFVLVDSESESAGASNGTIIRTGDTSSAATVNFTSSNLDAATVESSITFDAWEGTKSFIVTPIDDSSPNGIRQTLIEATAAGYAAGTALMNVEDDDALSVAIMDNTDSGFTSNGFRYNANKQLSQAYGGNNESLKGGEPGEEASWTFTGLTDGVYHVSATWNHQYDNNYNATDAQYSITNAADEAIGSAVINQSNVPSEFLDSGIAWGTLDTVTVTGGELVVTVSGGSNPNRHTVADAVRIARVAELGGSSMQSAEADPFYDPLEDALDDLAGEWGETSADEESLLWGE